MSNFIES